MDNLGTLGIPRIASTVVLTALAALVVIGGMSSLLKVTEKVVPIMSVLYMAGALVVIVLNIQNVPSAIASVFQYAFTGRAAVGGFAGAAVSQTIRWGVARGCFSNDAGNGSTTVAHSVAEVNHPIQQSIWAVFEVFFDTIIVCTMTCLVVLSTGVWQESMDPAVMTATAFQNTIGTAGGLLVTVAVVLFTFTTACAQIEFCTAHVARCRGTQILNVAFGGTIYQNLEQNGFEHHFMSNSPRECPIHRNTLEEGSVLHSVFGSTVRVNSFHHQAVHQPGEGVTVTARSEEGVPEGIEVAGGNSFVVGVQWHPEMMFTSEEQQKLFQALIAACRT